MKTPFFAALLMLGAMSLPAADMTAQFEAHDKAWAAAVAGADIPALEKMLADKLIYAHSTGNVDTKQTYIERLKSGKQKYDAINIEKSTVVPYGDTVITHSIMSMNGTSNGKPFNSRVTMMHVWVKQGGSWRLAAHQTTTIPK